MTTTFLRFLIIFLFTTVSLFSQISSEILCKVIDIQSKYPISYATVRFEGVQNGVIADEEGGFRLPLEFKESNRRIIISSIGFENITVNVGTLKTDIINILYLKPRVEELSAVVITATKQGGNKKYTPEAIVKNAIKNIPTNYPYTPHSYITYYRDYQLVNNNYYNLNEAIIENFDAGFNTSKFLSNANTAALYSYNLNKEFYQDTLLLNSIYGKSKSLDRDNNAKLGTDIQNELEILNIHNPIRNFNKSSFSFIYVFRDDFLINHSFRLSKIKYVKDTPLYEIEFFTFENPQAKYMGLGRIYISRENYAIHKLEYKVVTNKNYASIRSKDNPFGNMSRKSGNTLFEVNVEYKEEDGKMYLNYMTFNNRFIIKEPDPFKVEDFNFNSENERFYITFNKPVDESSLKRKSNIKLRYKNKKLIVNTIEKLRDKTISIDVVDWSAGLSSDISNLKSEDFTYKIKKIKDVFGATINKSSKLIGYQFRELYTQEIFTNKRPTQNLIYVNKALPLSSTKVNKPSFDVSRYWINTPLKKTKSTNNL